MPRNRLAYFSNSVLIIRYNRFPDNVINVIYKRSPLLKKLYLEFHDLSIDMPGNCNSLKELSLQRSQDITEDDVMYIVRNTPNLTNMSLFSKPRNICAPSWVCDISDRVIAYIANACIKLESLDINISRLSLTAARVDAIAHKCTNLRKLHINYAFDGELVNFGILSRQYRRLKYLFIQRCSFTDELLILLISF